MFWKIDSLKTLDLSVYYSDDGDSKKSLNEGTDQTGYNLNG
jgi:hypothetical protein